MLAGRSVLAAVVLLAASGQAQPPAPPAPAQATPPSANDTGKAPADAQTPTQPPASRSESAPPASAEPRAEKPGAAGEASKPAEGTAQKPPEEGPRKSSLVSLLGREITNRSGDSGRIIDVLIDIDGHSGAVVVEFGGFMGIGSRKVAVDWNALRYARDGNKTSFMVDISREQIRDAAEYKPNEPTAVLTNK